MTALKRIAAEIYGLFVDDLAFALAILACIALARLLLAQVRSLAAFSGLVLFAGLALLLVRSVLHFTERRPRR